MRKTSEGMQYSATDLVGYLNCQSLTGFDRLVAEGRKEAPASWSRSLELLGKRGEEHEEKYLEHLRSEGNLVHTIKGKGVDHTSVRATGDAMRQGADYIYQAALSHGIWAGRADVLQKVEGTSEFGGWSYEPIDAKLARETKAGTVLQLCLYAELIDKMGGGVPQYVNVMRPWVNYEPERFRFSDYAAYFRHIKKSFEDYQSLNQQAPYPDPKPHCDICRWRMSCDKRRRDDDHLSLVANMTKGQTVELESHGVATLEKLARLPIPIEFTPNKGSKVSIEKLREQARLQLEARETGTNRYELIPPEEGTGLSSLPEPNAGDIFLDFEGDRFYGEHGLDYLTGYVSTDDTGNWTYNGLWALSYRQERVAFEEFVDFVMQRWEQYPNLHIYHYAPYEPSAIKRMMGKYGSREIEVDQMLRANLFVDLYSVVRNGVRAGIESYSLKDLEIFFHFDREKPLEEASFALLRMETELEFGVATDISIELRKEVEAYNRDDCFATLELRKWLEEVRDGALAEGFEIERPKLDEEQQLRELDEKEARVKELREKLLKDVPADPTERNEEQQATWLLAYLLDFHRRENRSYWFEYFRLRSLTADEMYDERAGVSHLSFDSVVSEERSSNVYRYKFPPQELEIRQGDQLCRRFGITLGSVCDISIKDGIIDIKRSRKSMQEIPPGSENFHPDVAYVRNFISSNVIEDALFRMGQYFEQNGITQGKDEYEVARDLLLRIAPRSLDLPLIKEGEVTLEAARRLVCEMPSGVLPIQGPPGAGKTYTGSRMICALVAEGKKVGITANSHKVIRNLLDGVCEAAKEEGIDIRCIQKPKKVDEEDTEQLAFVKTKEDILHGLEEDYQVAGGTSWLWSCEEAHQSVDVLFVDEAAQLSLANVLAISGAAKTMVLLGDPQQLQQPIQGSHPEGTDLSALAHILNGRETIGEDQGLFLEETWRLHPKICDFTSEMFYAGKLNGREANGQQEIISSGIIDGSGLWYLPVQHEGNVNSSMEEVEAIAGFIERLQENEAKWIDRQGVTNPITLENILIITPYNAQVFEIENRISGARVGTVDKFQGQEAPIAIYTTATSTQADAPRGMEFLYNLNRFNVATSRAKCACVLVSSPELVKAVCKTPRQMVLANAFCRYLELADEDSGGVGQ